ncbi:hypothetical protein D9615_005981 [Tricholomella constricta]|uniref:Sec24-like protein n=1 Tax=Tricholomella constricta TaxID=117010 RepID=A0A8H5H9N6_9AGAR|nr:hypothetical protein D9615_005981 [Tricholomella constricta]
MYVHSNHIPQPPHSAGLSYKGLRKSINASQVPSPIEAVEEDKIKWEDQAYGTLPGKNAPQSTTDFITIDQGTSTQSTSWASDLSASQATLPRNLFPFAELDSVEEPVPLVDTGETGPARCERCRAYVNPWCLWVAGGTRWKCNLCSHETEVSSEYFCNLDANLMRLDHLQRPELNKGTVDFSVPKEYWAINPPEGFTLPYHTVEPRKSGPRAPEPMKYVFAFDVSSEAVLSGFLRASCACVRTILFGGTNADGVPVDACFPPGSSLAIFTYDQTIHFYDLSSDQVPMLVVPDIEEVFLPLRNGLFENPLQRREAIESLLNALPGRFEDSPKHDAALGSTLRSCLAALAGYGGQVIVFSSTMPTIGIGKLSGQPNESDLFDTDKERVLYKPRDSTWTDIGQEFAVDGIGVSMVLAPSKFMDIGSIGAVASLTGGDLFYHPRFDQARDEADITAFCEFDVQMVWALSAYLNDAPSDLEISGIEISSTYYGNFYQTSPTNLEFGILDADKAISVVLEHSGRSLGSRDSVYLQSSVLYTTVSGERRARICNLALPVADLAANVFRFADLDTTLCHLAREAMALRLKRKMSILREDLTEKCASMLLGYRKNCAVATRIDQLILPEAFKGLPAYTLALLKCKPLKGLMVSSDARNYHAHRINCMTVRGLIHYLYPQLMALHDLEDDAALPDEHGRTKIPTIMRSSHIFMEASGIYLIDNEESVIFWVGHSVSPQLLTDLFGVDDIMSLDIHLARLPTLETRLSTQVRNILTSRYARRGRLAKMYIARQNLDASEIEFSDMLVEDQNNGHMSYVDYLTVVHKQIAEVVGDIVSAFDKI